MKHQTSRMDIRNHRLSLLILAGLLAACNEPPFNGDAHDQQEQQVVISTAEEIHSLSPANPIRNAYFGDLHVHTSYALDSYIQFNRVDPSDAYRFARGESVELSGGRRQQLDIPLDFAAVTDHAEYLGELAICLNKRHSQYDAALCKEIRNENRDPAMIKKIFENLIVRDVLSEQPQREPLCGNENRECGRAARTIWQEMQDIAEEHNEPGEFTTLVGYEWTGNPNGANLHRNIIFRNTKVPDIAYSYFEANTPAKLWDLLNSNCRDDCEVLAIPHNSNQSRGRAFSPLFWDGTPMTARQAALRIEMEPLVEVMQTKGESECANGVGSADELCNFEKLDKRPLCPGPIGDMTFPDCAIECDAKGQPRGCASPRDYVRNALKDGLLLEASLGVNPFKLGIVGGTDTHNGTPGATMEFRYKGHHGFEDRSPEARALLPQMAVITPQRLKNPGALAGVWAEQNTRSGIFDALRRRETFATSGTRIKVRFFGGWYLPDDMTERVDMIELGYTSGVPMGGDLPPGAESAVPKFALAAMKALDGANLQRIQIIKGWTENGSAQEKVYDVACSDGLQPDDRTSRCPDNAAEPDLKDCRISSTKGAAELRAMWQDPDFKRSQRAFYYARVLENPSCRWSTLEALRENRQPFENVQRLVRERAWTSPIWYTPEES